MKTKIIYQLKENLGKAKKFALTGLAALLINSIVFAGPKKAENYFSAGVGYDDYGFSMNHYEENNLWKNEVGDKWQNIPSLESKGAFNLKLGYENNHYKLPIKASLTLNQPVSAVVNYTQAYSDLADGNKSLLLKKKERIDLARTVIDVCTYFKLGEKEDFNVGVGAGFSYDSYKYSLSQEATIKSGLMKIKTNDEASVSGNTLASHINLLFGKKISKNMHLDLLTTFSNNCWLNLSGKRSMTDYFDDDMSDSVPGTTESKTGDYSGTASLPGFSANLSVSYRFTGRDFKEFMSNLFREKKNQESEKSFNEKKKNTKNSR